MQPIYRLNLVNNFQLNVLAISIQSDSIYIKLGWIILYAIILILNPKSNCVKDFISKIKFRLNLGIALQALLISLILAAVITILWGLTYISRGHAVSSSIVYPVGLSFAVITTIAIWFCKKKNSLQSAIFADQFFNLKDSLTSAIEFEESNKEGHIYELQKKQAVTIIEKLSPTSIPLPISRKLTASACVGVIIAASLSIATPSEDVLKAIQEKEMTAKRTEEIKQSVEKEVEEMIKSLSEEEKEAIDPDAIRQWVKELKKTDDKREALRNIARIEQKIQKSIDSLQNRKNEELLKNAGLQMLKAQDPATKDIGEHLKNKEFKKAAEKLDEFKLRKDDKKDKAKELDPEKLAKLKADDKKSNKKEALSEKQKQLAKLRQLTKQLAQAAKQNQTQSNSSNSQSQSMSMENFAQMLEAAGIGELPENLTLDDLMQLPQELLDQLPPEMLNQLTPEMLNQLPPELLEKLLEMLEGNAQDLQEMMQEMDLEMMQGEPMTDEEWEEFLEQLRNMDNDLEALKKMLQRMEAMKQMRGRLQGLKQGLGLAQGYANGTKSQSEFKMRTQGKGGKKPGVGTDNTRRNEKDKLENNQQHSKLNGQKGLGPVKSSIESADSGTGTSNRKATSEKRSYEHQMSSFIEREDVSEEMKQAVKQYFQDIHNLETPPNEDSK